MKWVFDDKSFEIRYEDGTAVDVTEETMRRVVLCVNACAEVPNQAQEEGWTAGKVIGCVRSVSNQRDTLMSALRDLETAARYRDMRDDGVEETAGLKINLANAADNAQIGRAHV